MARTIALLAGLAGLGFMTMADAFACGDKFLVVGRGVKYGRSRASAQAASILIFRGAASQAKEVKLEANLKEAGHKVKAVDADTLSGALKAAKYDMVLADLADSPDLEKQIGSLASKPVVVPVLYKPTSDQLAAAKKEYGCALKAPSKDYLTTIDEIMAERAKATGSKSAKSSK